MMHGQEILFIQINGMLLSHYAFESRSDNLKNGNLKRNIPALLPHKAVTLYEVQI